MKRIALVLLLAACGDKREAAPAATAALPLPATPPTAPPTVLAEAKQLVTASATRDPLAWVALAHAQALAKLPDARTTLDAGLAAARADDKSHAGPMALVHAVEVFDALGDAAGATKQLDAAAAALAQHPARAALLQVLLSGTANLTHAPTLERLAALAAADAAYDRVLHASTPAAHAALTAKAPLESPALVALAAHARRLGKPDLASLETAAKLELSTSERLFIAYEAAASGAPALAKKLVERVPEVAHSEEVVERANLFAGLTLVSVLVGDKAGAAGFEKKALQAAYKDGDDIAEETAWILLATARGLGGNVDGALELVREHLKDKPAAGRVAYELADGGAIDAAKRVLAEMLQGEAQFDATANVVDVLALTNLDVAKQIVLTATMWKMKLPGAEHVMRASALRGDLEEVRMIGAKAPALLDGFTDLTARSLARDGKCDEAVRATQGVQRLAMSLAVVARYCANARR